MHSGDMGSSPPPRRSFFIHTAELLVQIKSNVEIAELSTNVMLGTEPPSTGNEAKPVSESLAAGIIAELITLRNRSERLAFRLQHDLAGIDGPGAETMREGEIRRPLPASVIRGGG